MMITDYDDHHGGVGLMGSSRGGQKIWVMEKGPEAGGKKHKKNPFFSLVLFMLFIYRQQALIARFIETYW